MQTSNHAPMLGARLMPVVDSWRPYEKRVAKRADAIEFRRQLAAEAIAEFAIEAPGPLVRDADPADVIEAPGPWIFDDDASDHCYVDDDLWLRGPDVWIPELDEWGEGPDWIAIDDDETWWPTEAEVRELMGEIDVTTLTDQEIPGGWGTGIAWEDLASLTITTCYRPDGNLRCPWGWSTGTIKED